MMPDFGRWQIALVVLLLAAAFVLFRDPLQTPSPEATTSPAGAAGKPADIWPETILRNSETLQYNQKGQAQYRLASKQIRFFKQQAVTNTPERIDYEQPRLKLYPESTGDNSGSGVTETVIEAKQGWSDGEGEHIRLRGDVVITQFLVNGKQNQLTTEALDVWPERQFATSDKPVIITQPEGTTFATGLKVWFKDKKIELLSAVRGQYAPP